MYRVFASPSEPSGVHRLMIAVLLEICACQFEVAEVSPNAAPMLSP